MAGWKTDRPWQTAHASITAAVKAGADAPEDISQRDARRKHIGDLKNGSFFQRM